MKPTHKHVAETFDAFKDDYAEAVNTAVAFTGLDVDYFTRVKAGYIIEIATEKFRDLSVLNLLDIGCGIGNFHPLLTSHFGGLTGVDISSSSIATARNRNPDVSYKEYDGSKLPFESGTFDVAMAICVIHHVPTDDWEKFASEMHRVLRPGGLALVFEHNPRNPLTLRAVNNCPFDEDAVLLRSEKTIDLLKSAGFEDCRARFILSVPSGNAVLRRIDRWFSRLPFGAQYVVSAQRLARQGKSGNMPSE